MTKLNQLFFFVFVSIFFINCSGEKSKNAKRDFNAFPVQEQLNLTDLFKADQFTVDLIDLYKDSIILMINGAAKNEKHHFNLYDINKKQFLPGIIEMGRKDGQSLSFLSYGIEKDYIWVYDENKQQVISFNMDSLQENRAKHFIKTSHVPGWYYSVGLLNDTTLLAGGDYNSPLDYKIAMINLTTGKTIENMITYSADPSKPYSREDKTAYESLIYIKPVKDKAVLACRYADQIEIVDLKSQQSKIVRGPEGFEPDLDVMAGSNGKRRSIRNEHTRFAFVSGNVTNKFIYLLYSGNTDRTQHRDYGSAIYVYDWDGKPVKKLSLKNDIQDFAVTANDSLIYTFSPETKFISVVHLK